MTITELQQIEGLIAWLERKGRLSARHEDAAMFQAVASKLKEAVRERDEARRNLAESDYALIMSNSDETEWNDRCRNALATARQRQEAKGEKG